jgi:hypothetical protein
MSRCRRRKLVSCAMSVWCVFTALSWWSGDGIAAKDAALASPRAWSSARIVSQAGLDGSLAHAQ